MSAHEAPGWVVMVAGQVVLAGALGALGMIVARSLGRRGWPGALLLGLAALGTVQASAFRTICNRTDTRWCAQLPRSAYPHSQWAHGIGTALAFGGLQLAVVVTTWSVRGLPERRRLRFVGGWTVAVSVPFMVWFLANAETSWHGFAEKVFLVVLAGWVCASARLLGAAPRPGAPARRFRVAG